MNDKTLYKWRDGARFSADPQIIGEEIARLDSPTSEEIVKAARDDETLLLSSLFEWDIEKAAYENWLMTAQNIARNLVIEVQVIEAQKQPFVVRAFESVQTSPGETKRYVPVLEVLSKNELREQAMARLIRDLKAAQQQIRAYNYLSDHMRTAEQHLLDALFYIEAAKKQCATNS